MILTGKCKEKFLEWYREPETYFYRLNNTCQNALIIEFFDNNDIFICVTLLFPIYIYGWSYSIDLGYCYEYFKTRQEATIQAIKKANDLYNERFSL